MALIDDLKAKLNVQHNILSGLLSQLSTAQQELTVADKNNLDCLAGHSKFPRTCSSATLSALGVTFGQKLDRVNSINTQISLTRSNISEINKQLDDAIASAQSELLTDPDFVNQQNELASQEKETRNKYILFGIIAVVLIIGVVIVIRILRR